MQVASLAVGGNDGRTLVVRWTDGDEASYSYCWLRDNCRCHGCFDHVKRRRIVAFHDVDLDASVVNAQVSQLPLYVLDLLVFSTKCRVKHNG